MARRIGKTRATVTAFLRYERYFSPMKADLFASAFGFSRNFLMYGEGDIISPEDKTQHEPGPEKPSSGDTAPCGGKARHHRG